MPANHTEKEVFVRSHDCSACSEINKTRDKETSDHLGDKIRVRSRNTTDLGEAIALSLEPPTEFCVTGDKPYRLDAKGRTGFVQKLSLIVKIARLNPPLQPALIFPTMHLLLSYPTHPQIGV